MAEPKSTKLFPESTLVNQKPGDDIPFEVDADGAPKATAQGPIDGGGADWQALGKQLGDLQNQNATLRASNHDLKNKLDDAISGERNGLTIFCAILQGFAARGDLSVGRLVGDAEVQKICRQAAGITQFALEAAKAARL